MLLILRRFITIQVHWISIKHRIRSVRKPKWETRFLSNYGLNAIRYLINLPGAMSHTNQSFISLSYTIALPFLPYCFSVDLSVLRSLWSVTVILQLIVECLYQFRTSTLLIIFLSLSLSVFQNVCLSACLCLCLSLSPFHLSFCLFSHNYFAPIENCPCFFKSWCINSSTP